MNVLLQCILPGITLDGDGVFSKLPSSPNPYVPIIISCFGIGVAIFIYIYGPLPRPKFEWQVHSFEAPSSTDSNETIWHHRISLRNIGRRAATKPNIVIVAPTKILDHKVQDLSGDDAFEQQIKPGDPPNRLVLRAARLIPKNSFTFEFWTATKGPLEKKVLYDEGMIKEISKVDDYPSRTTNIPVSLFLTIGIVALVLIFMMFH